MACARSCKRALVVRVWVFDRGVNVVAQNVLYDEFASGLQAAIDVQRGNDCFYRIGQQHLLVPAPAHLLTAAELKEAADSELLRNAMQMSCADDVRFQLGQPSLGPALMRRTRTR